MNTARAFRIRKHAADQQMPRRKTSQPSQTPRRKSSQTSKSPSKWDDSYVVEPIPLYNALNDIHWQSVKQGLKKKVSERYSVKSTNSSASSLKTRREPLFAKDDDIKKAKLELKNAWHAHRIPVYYQQLFEDWFFFLPKQKALVLILLETSRLEEGNAPIQNCMIAIKARENSLVNLRRLEPNLRETRDYPGFVQVKTRKEYEQLIAHTIDAVNSIVNWRNELASARKQSGKKERKITFRFNNQNYLIKMLKDTDFLHSRDYLPIVSVKLPPFLMRKLQHAEVVMEQEALLQQQETARETSNLRKVPRLAIKSSSMDPEDLSTTPRVKQISGLQQKYRNKLKSHSTKNLASSISEKLIEKQLEPIVIEIEREQISLETTLNRVAGDTFDIILMCYVKEIARKTLYNKLRLPKTLPKIENPKFNHPYQEKPADSQRSPRKFYFTLPKSLSLEDKQKEISTREACSPQEIQKAPEIEIKMSPRASTQSTDATPLNSILPAFEVVKQILSAKDLLNYRDIGVQIFGKLLDKILEELIGVTLKCFEKEEQEANVLSEQIWNSMIETLITDVIFIPQMEEEQERIQNEKLKKQAAIAEDIFDSILGSLVHNVVKVHIDMMHDDVAGKILDEMVIEIIPSLVAQPSMEDERKSKTQDEEDERKLKAQCEEDERKSKAQREADERKLKAKREEDERKAKAQREEASKQEVITGIFDSLIGKILPELVVLPQIEEEKLAVKSGQAAQKTIVTDIFDSFIGKIFAELVALPSIEEEKLILQKEKEAKEAIARENAQAAQEAIVMDIFESMIGKLLPDLVVLPSIEKVKLIVKYENTANEKTSENVFDEMVDKLLPDIIVVPSINEEKQAELFKSVEGIICAATMEDLLTDVIQDSVVMPCMQAEMEEAEKAQWALALVEQVTKLEQDIAELTEDGLYDVLILEFCTQAYEQEVKELWKIAHDILDGITDELVPEACKEQSETEKQQALEMDDYVANMITDDLYYTFIDEQLVDALEFTNQRRKSVMIKEEVNSLNLAPDDWFKTNPDYTTSFTPVNVHHISIENLYREYRDTLPLIMKNISLKPKALIALSNSGINTEWFWVTENAGKSFGLLVYTHELSRDGTRKSVVLHFTTIKQDVFQNTAAKLLPHFREVDKWVELRLYINYATDPYGDLFLEYDIKDLLQNAGLRWKSSSEEVEGTKKVEIMGQNFSENQRTFATHFECEFISRTKMGKVQKFDESQTDMMKQSGCRMNSLYLLMPYVCCYMESPNNIMQTDMDDRFSVLAQMKRSAIHDENFDRITDTSSRLRINDFYPSGNSVIEKGVPHLAIQPPNFTAIPLADEQMVYFVPTHDPNIDLFFVTCDLEKLEQNMTVTGTDLFQQVKHLLALPSTDPGDFVRQLWIPSFKAQIEGRVPWLDGFDCGDETYVTEYSESVSIRHSVEDPAPGLLHYAQMNQIVHPPFIFGAKDNIIHAKFDMPLFVTIVREIGL